MFSDYKRQIIKEISTAVNIKNKSNKKNVIMSLKMIKNFLKKIKNDHVKNGLIIFSGIDVNNKSIFLTYFMHVPLKYNLYRCCKKFYVDFLIPYCEKIDKYLVIFMTGKESWFYEKTFTEMKLLKRISFERQKRQKKGGFSQARIARLREEKILGFSNKIFDYLKNYKNKNNYKSIIIGGNGSIVSLLKKKFDNVMKLSFIKIISHDELLEKCNLIISNIDNEYGNCKIKEYMDMMEKGDEKLLYGNTYISEMIKQNLVDEIILHKKSKYYDIFKNFKNVFTINEGTVESDIFLKNFEGIMGKLFYKDNLDQIYSSKFE